ncbi:NAD(P)-binding protein [Lentinus brumalis]|uniref:NAD(P)-binding protein n=1 Tax=Lentinus brumalis TaxID=2498619 RepID=A0A371CJT9_9APHY|nr:NAD(P)-binding protein [Polyporus brumalis]
MAQEYVWLITGANRGIGLEMVKQLLQSPSNTVVAACRSPAKATELQQLAEKAGGKLHVVALDVSDKESVNKAAKEVAGILGGRGIDYLVNNAGVRYPYKLPGFLESGHRRTTTNVQDCWSADAPRGNPNGSTGETGQSCTRLDIVTGMLVVGANVDAHAKPASGGDR